MQTVATGAKVYVAAVSEVNSSSVRGEQLLQQMKPWAARDGVAPELLASVTTMASGIGVKTNAWDISDLAMQELSEPSDGAIISCAARLGKVIRADYSWNHIDEMNHIFGLIGKGAPSPAQFYLTHATRLKLAGV